MNKKEISGLKSLVGNNSKKVSVSNQSKLNQIKKQGRGGDTEIASIPPLLIKFLNALIHHGKNQINPHTGLREYTIFQEILKGLGKGLLFTGLGSSAPEIGGYMYGNATREERDKFVEGIKKNSSAYDSLSDAQKTIIDWAYQGTKNFVPQKPDKEKNFLERNSGKVLTFIGDNIGKVEKFTNAYSPEMNDPFESITPEEIRERKKQLFDGFKKEGVDLAKRTIKSVWKNSSARKPKNPLSWGSITLSNASQINKNLKPLPYYKNVGYENDSFGDHLNKSFSYSTRTSREPDTRLTRSYDGGKEDEGNVLRQQRLEEIKLKKKIDQDLSNNLQHKYGNFSDLLNLSNYGKKDVFKKL